MKKILLIAIVVAIIGAAGAALYVFRKSSDSVLSEKTNMEVTVNKIVDDFENNEAISNESYLNKVIVVSGKVHEISETGNGFSVYLLADNQMVGVLCSFSEKSFSERSINVGEAVKIKGLCTGFLFDVVFNKCGWPE